MDALALPFQGQLHSLPTPDLHVHAHAPARPSRSAEKPQGQQTFQHRSRGLHHLGEGLATWNVFWWSERAFSDSPLPGN